MRAPKPGEQRRRHRLLAALSVTAGVLAATQAAAWAAAGTGSSPVFGVRPALFGRTSMPAGHYNYAVEAGSTIADAIVLTNFTVNPITLSVYGVDAATTGAGQVVAGEPGGAQHSVGAWLRVSRSTVTLLPYRSDTDHFRLSVPKGTPPGDYLGAVVASFGSAQRVDGGVAFEARAALAVDVRVVGAVHVVMSVSLPSVSRSGGTDRFEVVVSNHGNVLVELTSARLEMRGGGTSLGLGAQGVYVVPGGRATLSATWNDLPFLGHEQAEAVVAGSVAGKPAGTWRSPSLSLWFVPWLVIGLVTAALVLIVASNRRWRRWLRELHQARRLVATLRAGSSA
jgi:hypothetical protein